MRQLFTYSLDCDSNKALDSSSKLSSICKSTSCTCRYRQVIVGCFNYGILICINKLSSSDKKNVRTRNQAEIIQSRKVRSYLIPT